VCPPATFIFAEQRTGAATGRGFTVTSGVVHHAIQRFGSPTRSHSNASHAASRHPPEGPSVPAATRDWQTGFQRQCKDSFAGGCDDKGRADGPFSKAIILNSGS